jgi:hypothetical protein
VTLVASPCNVPFMAAAMGYAISWTKKLMPVALPPGPGEAGDETKRDRVFGDRDRRAAGVAIAATRRQIRSATSGAPARR